MFQFYSLTYILFKSIHQDLRFADFFSTRPKCSSSDGLQKGPNFRYVFLIWVGRLTGKSFFHDMSLDGLQKGPNFRYIFLIWVGRLTGKSFFHVWKRIEVSRGLSNIVIEKPVQTRFRFNFEYVTNNEWAGAMST